MSSGEKGRHARPLFRPVAMPAGVEGRLYLHAMPGRREPLSQSWSEIADSGIAVLVSLTGFEEIRAASPELAAAIVSGSVPCEHVTFDIPNFGVPEQEDEYLRFVREMATRVRSGDSLLIHCHAGIGRTGTLAVSILTALGEPLESALRVVRDADAGPVNDAQSLLVERIAERLEENHD